MDSLEQVKKLREEYERALDAAESRRTAYHEAVHDLHQSGTPLREIAQQLGLSHQRVHQIVSGELPRQRNLKRAVGGGAAALVVLALLFGGLRLAQAPPFAPKAPRALHLIDRNQITQIAYRVARDFGDPQPQALAISQNVGGGEIHITMHGHFLNADNPFPKTVAGAVLAATDTRITFALDPRSFHLFGVKEYAAGNSP